MRADTAHLAAVIHRRSSFLVGQGIQELAELASPIVLAAEVEQLLPEVRGVLIQDGGSHRLGLEMARLISPESSI